MKEAGRGRTIQFGLYESIDHSTVLIDSAPSIVLHAVDLQKHFVELPFVTKLRPTSLEFGGVRRTEFVTPTPDGFVAQLDSPEGHHEFDISQAQGKVEVQPHTLEDDFFRKPVAAIRSLTPLQNLTSSV